MSLPHFPLKRNTFEPIYKNLFEVLFTNENKENEYSEYVYEVNGLKDLFNYKQDEFVHDTITIKVNLTLYNTKIEPIPFLLEFLKLKDKTIFINQYNRVGEIFLKIKLDNIKTFKIIYTNSLSYDDNSQIDIELQISDFNLSHNIK